MNEKCLSAMTLCFFCNSISTCLKWFHHIRELPSSCCKFSDKLLLCLCNFDVSFAETC